MNPRTKENGIEWGFAAALLALCAILTALQYRWTGEVAGAELTRLRSQLAAPAQEMTRAFDAELAESCTQLMPTLAEIQSHGREAAHLDRIRQWMAAKPRPLFSRM